MLDLPPIQELDRCRFGRLIDLDQLISLQIFQQSRDIRLGNMINVGTAGILHLFRVAAEPPLIIGIGPHQGKEPDRFQ